MSSFKLKDGEPSPKKRRVEDERLLWNRWKQQHQQHFLQLLRQSCAMYEWNSAPMERGIPASAHHLLGVHDVVFCHGIPHRIDRQEVTDFFSISRSMNSGGTVTFALQTIPPGDYLWGADSQAVYGTMAGIRPSQIDHGDHDCWQHSLQMGDDLEFRETPRNFFEFNIGRPENGLLFDVTKDDGVPMDGPEAVTLSVLSNEGTFPWTPSEVLPTDNNDQPYRQYLRRLLEQRKEDQLYGWNPDHSWLSHHKGLPTATASLIQSFVRYGLPPASWSWKRGDLFVQIERQKSYRTSWTTYLILRPQEEWVRERVLMGLQPCIPPPTESSSDSEHS